MTWNWTGRTRPPFAVAPGPGQESVWDYPRPPRIAPDSREVVVSLDGRVVARTRRAVRVLETASPPTWYLPRADIDTTLLQPAAGSSFCEWKGRASYGSVIAGAARLDRVAWWYDDPAPAFAALRDHVGFYPSPLVCTVDGERAQPQPGRFYAGWLTADVAGPVKGGSGTEGW